MRSLRSSICPPQVFNSVVAHYDSPPPTGGDFGEIFVADNMIVTASVVPEPGGLVLLGIGIGATRMVIGGIAWDRS